MMFLLSGTESFLEYSFEDVVDADEDDLAGMKISEEKVGCCCCCLKSLRVGEATVEASEATEAA